MMHPACCSTRRIVRLPAHRRRPWVFVGLLLLGASPVQASDPAMSPEDAVPAPFVERQQVRYVTLDLLIDQRRGMRRRPLEGVRAADLQVQVDGQVVELDQFEDHCGARSAPAAPGATSPETPSDQGGPRRFVLYIDLSWIDQGSLVLATDAARSWAGSLDPDARVMIVLASRRLRVVRPFLPASEHLKEDLDAALEEAMSAYLWTAWREARASETAGQQSVRGGMIGPPPAATAFRAEAELRTQRTWSRMDLLMTLFTGIPGTKYLVLFSEDLRFYEGHQGMVRGLARSANKQDVRFYPVAADGGRVSDALTYLSAETGGRYLERTNQIGRIFGLIDEDLACFYRVGFRLPDGVRTTSAAVRVTLPDHRGTRVRHRRSLEIATPEETARDRLLAAMVVPEETDGLPVSLSATTLVSGPATRVRIEIRVPLGAFLDLPEDGGRRIAFQAGATLVPLLDEGERGEVPLHGGGWAAGEPWSFADGAVLRMSGAHDVGAPDLLLFAREVAVPPGTYRVIAVAEDTASGDVGAATDEILVPATAEPLGPVQLAAAEPGAILVAEDRALGSRGEGGNGRFAILDSSFRDDAVRIPAEELGPGRAGWAVYHLCDPADRDGSRLFSSWELHRTLACGDGNTLRLPPRVLPRPELGESCALAIDRIPDLPSTVGRCVFVVILRRPGEPVEERRLEFRARREEGATTAP